MFDLAPISKAVAGGLVTAVVAEFARFGLTFAPATTDAINVIATAVIAYAIGHVVVFLSPANKPKL
ncbi:hypothetical protein AHiyo6_01000 [Arthrobacter sp. Hiyo6]|nr:hypothetical protein AHiyo6_01000 [Arthrobacter sp. Hiyo6]